MIASAVAWDIDGTLIDSEPLHLVALQHICGGYGADISDLPDDAFRGVHMVDVWTALRPRLPLSLTRDVWLAGIVDAYVERARDLRPMEDVREVVAELAERGIRQVCVSNASRRIVDANIDTLGIGHLLEFSISFDDVSAGKPDPEPYRSACDRLGLPPRRVAAVEDSAAGAASAHGAGLFVLAFSPHGRSFGGADAVAAGLREVPALLADGAGRPPSAAVRRPPPAMPEV